MILTRFLFVGKKVAAATGRPGLEVGRRRGGARLMKLSQTASLLYFSPSRSDWLFFFYNW